MGRAKGTAIGDKGSIARISYSNGYKTGDDGIERLKSEMLFYIETKKAKYRKADGKRDNVKAYQNTLIKVEC